MGYDAYMKIDTGGEYPATVAEIGNHTSNTTGMWREALGCPLRDLSGKLGSELIPQLERAVADMRDPARREVYQAMNPPNGWGSHTTATNYLDEILAACREHPKASLYLST